MKLYLATLLSCSAAMSVISIIYIAFTPFLSRKYTAKWLYYIWLLVVIGWVFPFRPYLNIVSYHLPKAQVIQTKYTLINQNMNYIANATKEASTVSIWLIILCIWAAGAAGVIIFNLLRHFRFLKLVGRWSEKTTNQDILHMFNELKMEMNIKTRVGLKTCFSISSPMMIGFFSPAILLPDENMAADDLKFILRHELIHLKRNDLWYKTLVLVATAIHWFNPVVYFMARAISIQCEISNDELLVKETSFQQRRQYGETLIGAIRNGANLHTALSTDFYSGGKTLKTRIFSIMDMTKKKAGIIILCFTIAAVLGSGIAYASDSTDGSSSSTQIIHVDVKKLDAGHIICFKGPYHLKKGDIVRYNITSDNNDNLYVDVIQKDSIVYGKPVMSQRFLGYYLGYPKNQAIISSSMEGDYCLLVKFLYLQGAHNIKGSIEIIKGKDND